MSSLGTTLTVIFSIPGSVWLLASILTIADCYRSEEGISKRILSVAIGVVTLLMIALLTHTNVIWVFSIVFVCVTFLHAAWFLAARRWLIGVPHYSLEPPERPVELPEETP